MVSGELLFCHILPIENNDGHTQEQVEVVRLWREWERLVRRLILEDKCRNTCKLSVNDNVGSDLCI